MQNEEESYSFQSLVVPPVFCGVICVRMETSHVSIVCMTLWLGHGWFYKYYESFQPRVQRIYVLSMIV